MPIDVVDRGAHFETQVHYRELIFDNKREVLNPFRGVLQPEKVFQNIWGNCIEPIMRMVTNRPTQNVIKKEMEKVETQFCTKYALSEYWTWRQLKTSILGRIFYIVEKLQYTQFSSLVKQCGGYIDDENIKIDGIDLHQAITVVYFQLLKFAYDARASLKCFWQHNVLVHTEKERSHYLQNLTRSISNKRRWLAFDIESDYKPHVVKEESVISISTMLFNHDDPEPLEYVLFLRMPPNVEIAQAHRHCPIKKVIELIKSQFDQSSFTNMKENETFFIHFFETENCLLEQFPRYVLRCQCSFICFFNGFKYDLPFLAQRHNKFKKEGHQDFSQFRSIKYSFTSREDQGTARLAHNYKASNYKSYGVGVYCDQILEERDRTTHHNHAPTLLEEADDEEYEQDEH